MGESKLKLFERKAMIKYVLTSSKFEGQIVVGYKDGRICLLDLSTTTLSDKQFDYILTNLPVHEADVKIMVSKSQDLKMVFVPEDLSFERFWTDYNYKIGNKKRAEKLWCELTEADKITALNSIPKYLNFLQRKSNIERLYPETFLSQRRFENQF